MNLILCEPGEVAGDGRVRLTGVRATHLREVLRVTPGAEVRVGVVDGPRGRGTVLAIDETGVELRCRLDEPPPAPPAIDLLLALPRPKVMRRLWAQLAALGVGRIVLTNAFRVERHYFDTHVLDEQTYRPLLIEGLQQAKDTRLPRVSIHRQFRILIEDDLDALSGPDALRLVAHPDASTPVTAAITTAIRDQPHPPTPARVPVRVLLAIGPEGGWNPFELDLLQRHRFQPVAMGPRVLRTDTACIALLALVDDALRALTPSDPARPAPART